MMFAETQHTDLENKKVSASRVESGKWLKEVISEQQIKLRCAGGAELKFVFAGRANGKHSIILVKTPPAFQCNQDY